MVPIHDSDLAENRWREGEWRQFELWERIELRLRRKRSWLVFAVAVLFLGILAVPVIRDRVPKWHAKHTMRELAVRVNQMKIDAASLGVPLRLSIYSSAEGPAYRLDRVESCDSSRPDASTEWGGGALFTNASIASRFLVLGSEEARALGLERVTTTFCYDPFVTVGSETPISPPTAMAILTANDLTESRLDRIGFLNFSGLFTEIDFD